MSIQVTTIIITAIIAICYLVAIVLDYFKNKEKLDLKQSIQSEYERISINTEQIKKSIFRMEDNINDMKEVLCEEDPYKWISVKDALPPVNKEVIVLISGITIYFGHIVDKKIAKDYNGWNMPNVEYWLPFVNPKDK